MKNTNPEVIGGNTKKRGRKSEHFRTADDKVIEGLARRPSDGRWRIIGTPITFVESDEQTAIARFKRWKREQAAKAEPEVGKSIAFDDIDDAMKAMRRRLKSAHSAVLVVSPDEDAVAVEDMMLLPEQWRWLTKQFLTRAPWVAEQCGLPELGWYREWKKPEKLPSFTEIEAIWEQFYKKSPEQKRRVMDAWKDFKKTTKVTALSDITPTICIAFRDNVHARELAPKSESNMFTRIRRLFTFVRDREIAPDAMAKAIDALSRLKPSDTTVSLDPHPIEREAFHKLVNAADDQGKAMLLLMLNGAFNLVEVIRLQWSEIRNDTIIARRMKSGRCIRVCVLWKETVEALAKLPRQTEYIFMSREGINLTASGAEKRFRAIRKAANVSDSVTSSHLRDGAATALAAAGIDGVTFSICMGHSSGIKDHYIKSNPTMVAPACKAIREAYFDTD
jgi:integrase